MPAPAVRFLRARFFLKIGVDGGAENLVNYPRFREKGNAIQRPVLVVAQLR